VSNGDQCSENAKETSAMTTDITKIPTGLERITIIPGLCNGKPTIRGMRITVETVLGFLAAGDSTADILDEYPMLDAADIAACLAFASRSAARRYAVDAAS
jgi:uncharacterized protein (DUF433 family)